MRIVLTIAGGLLIATGLASVAWQYSMWLRDGYWHALPFIVAWTWTESPLPEYGWLSVGWDGWWIFKQPLSIVLLAVGWALLMLGYAGSGRRRF
jgi:hypothetical protein